MKIPISKDMLTKNSSMIAQQAATIAAIAMNIHNESLPQGRTVEAARLLIYESLLALYLLMHPGLERKTPAKRKTTPGG